MKFEEFLNKANRVLNEMPMVFDTKVNPSYIDEHLVRLIHQGIDKQEFMQSKSSPDVWVYPISKIQSIYVVVHNNEIVGGANIVATKYCDTEYVYPKIIKKFIDNYPALALKIYKAVNKDWELPIISDTLQSKDASNMWKKWYNNPSKYGIKQVGVIDTRNKDCKSEVQKDVDIWGLNDNTKSNILVYLDFI